MSASTTSRYHGIATLCDDQGRAHVAQRPVPPHRPVVGDIAHVVIAGETLDQLAKRYYGLEELWWRIADANPPRHPSDWRAGDILSVPILGATRAIRG